MTDKPEIQVFEIQARPLAIPPALASLSPNAEIKLIDRVGGVNGESRCKAGDYLEELRTTIARQTQGYLTVAEAAQALEDAEPGVVAKDMKREMLNAFQDDQLVIRNPGDKMPTRAKDTVRDFIHLVRASEVDEWLKKSGVSYRLSAPAQNTAMPVPVVAVGALGEPAKAGPVEGGLPTKEIAVIFDGVNGWDANRWTKNLSASKWLHPARTAPGVAGGASAVWSPLTLAQLMHGKTKGDRARELVMKAFNSRFNQHPALMPWRDAFNEYFATHCTTD